MLGRTSICAINSAEGKTESYLFLLAVWTRDAKTRESSFHATPSLCKSGCSRFSSASYVNVGNQCCPEMLPAHSTEVWHKVQTLQKQEGVGLERKRLTNGLKILQC